MSCKNKKREKNNNMKCQEFTGYREINQIARKQAASDEIDKWGKFKEEFRKYREQWERATNEGILPEYPLHVDIELTDLCNLRCKMCVHGIKGTGNFGMMDKKTAFRLIDESKRIGVYSIKFNWRGEATLNKILPEAVKYAKEKTILEVQINTNGLPVNNDIILECAKGGIDRIIFSIDGFSNETYESIRIGGEYQKLLNNVHELIEWKAKNNRQKPFIRVQMVKTKENAHEVMDYIDYWQPRVDDVRISDVMNRGQGDEMFVGDQVPVGRRRCPQPFQRLVIGREGKVSPCCADWNQEYVVGDINKEGLLDIWHGKRMSFIREIQSNSEHERIAICKNCCVKESYIWSEK
ncbi:radical SAM/SPASM domain-containing protein [Elusimicrobiota bacterium]